MIWILGSEQIFVTDCLEQNYLTVGHTCEEDVFVSGICSVQLCDKNTHSYEPHLFWLPVSGWQQYSPLDSCNWIAVPWCDVMCWWFPGRDTEVEMFPLRLFCIMKLCHTAFALHKSISAMSQVLMVISAPHTQTYDVFVETRPMCAQLTPVVVIVFSFVFLFILFILHCVTFGDKSWKGDFCKFL